VCIPARVLFRFGVAVGFSSAPAQDSECLIGRHWPAENVLRENPQDVAVNVAWITLLSCGEYKKLGVPIKADMYVELMRRLATETVPEPVKCVLLAIQLRFGKHSTHPAANVDWPHLSGFCCTSRQ
jgi:hypothetical protein